ncbi:MAG: cobamide remodeling phosphodiesterase CbiR [Desulfococcaceae bacterium]
MPDAYRPLPKNYRNRHPFRLAAPSFIWPDTWAANARMLAPAVDEVELLLFESNGLPDEAEIRELERIRRDAGLGYNVHLPTDGSLTDPDQWETAARALQTAMERTGPLEPTVFILHLPAPKTITEKRWRETAHRGLESLLSNGVPSRRLAVETLEDGPFDRIQPIVEDFDLSVCLDTGHLLLRAENPVVFLETHRKRIAAIHLHGVADGKDHQPLSRFPDVLAADFAEGLNDFQGVVSLEVFGYDSLVESLEILESWFPDRPNSFLGNATP